MSNNVNHILLRPVLGTVRQDSVVSSATDSVLLKMEELMSRLRSGHRAASLFLLVAVTVSVKWLRNVRQPLSL